MKTNYPPVRCGRCPVEIEDSYRYRGRFVLYLKGKSRTNGWTNEFFFDDQIEDMIRALKRVRSQIFWRRVRRIFFGW